MRQVRDQVFHRGDDRIFGGVSSGLGATFHINPLWLRIGFVALAFLQGIGLLIYIVLWLVMPERVEGEAGRSGVDSVAGDLRRLTAEVRDQLRSLFSTKPAAVPGADPGGAGTPAQESRPAQAGRRNSETLLLGVVLVVVGATLLGVNSGLIDWGVIWPAALIFLGVALLARTWQRR
jgi:phage shock protein C